MALILSAVALCSCEEPVEIPQELYLNAQITNLGLTGFDVVVDVPEAVPFYIARYTRSDFEKYGISADKLASELGSRVEYGANWNSILKIGSQTVNYRGLQTDTDYKIIVFGLNGAGEITIDPVVLDTRTDGVSFNMELEESTPFTYSMKVTPSRSDIGWYGFSFMGKRSVLEGLSDEMVKTYMEYYISNDRNYGATFDEIAKLGEAHFDGESYPDLYVLFTLAAVDSDLRIVSGIERYLFEPDLTGFVSIDEKTTKNLHTLIYAYDHKELGVLFHVTGYDTTGDMGVMAMETFFNGGSAAVYGVDFYSAPDTQVADLMASLYQYQFDMYRKDPQWIPYFENCETPQQMLEMVWYNPANFYDSGRVWDRNSVEDIIEYCGSMPDQTVFAVSINKINNAMKIYPAEYCISRCSFSELGYEFEIAAAAQTGKKNYKPAVDPVSGKQFRFERKTVGKIIN